MQELYFLKVKPLWNQFWKEGFSFWMICGYLFFEYVRPQSIVPSINFLPWTSILILLSALGLLFDSNRKWVSDRLNKWIIAFYLVILVSTYTGYNTAISRHYLEFFYTWLIIYFLIINTVTTKERFYIFLLIFLLASFKLSSHGAQVWVSRGFGFTKWGITGPRGFFGNSGELSIQMLVFFPVAYYLFIALKDYVKPWEKFILLLFIITPVMTILGASSRGAQLALSIQCIVMFYKQIFRVKVLLGISISVLVVMSLLPEEQKERFRTMGDDKTSEQRILYWTNGIEMIKDHPFFGVGFFNFVPYYERYYYGDMLYPEAELPHNIFIQVGTDTGLVGLFIYIVMLSRFLLKKKATGNSKDDIFFLNMQKGISIGILGFVVAGQFVSVVYYPFMWIGLALYVSLQNCFRKEI